MMVNMRDCSHARCNNDYGQRRREFGSEAAMHDRDRRSSACSVAEIGPIRSSFILDARTHWRNRRGYRAADTPRR